jgi:hypothetical protein
MRCPGYRSTLIIAATWTTARSSTASFSYRVTTPPILLGVPEPLGEAAPPVRVLADLALPLAIPLRRDHRIGTAPADPLDQRPLVIASRGRPAAHRPGAMPESCAAVSSN